MKIGVIVPQGWIGEYDGWDPLAAWRRTRGRRAAGRAARLRVDLAVRPLPHGPPPDRRDHVRVVHRAVGAGRPDDARAARPHRHLHRVPQPGPDGQDDLDDGHDQRRPDGARDRRRLEAGRVAGLRLRVPRDARAARPARRRPRGHRPDARRRPARPRHVRRPATRHVRDAINVPKPIQQPRVPIMVGGNGPNVTWRLAARHADELNLDGMSARGGRRGAAGHPVALRGDRPRPGDAAGLGPHLARAPGRPRPGQGGPAGRLPGGRGRPGDDDPRRVDQDDEALESLAADARAAGLELA